MEQKESKERTISEESGELNKKIIKLLNEYIIEDKMPNETFQIYCVPGETLIKFKESEKN